MAYRSTGKCSIVLSSDHNRKDIYTSHLESELNETQMHATLRTRNEALIVANLLKRSSSA